MFLIFQEALRLIQEKSYGKIISLTADFGFFVPFDQTNRVFDKKTDGGNLLDTGIYPVFAVLPFLGIPESIWAEASFFQNNTDASCRMILRYQDAKAFLGSTLLENAPVEALIVCEHAKIKIHSRFHEPSNISIEKNGQIH